MTHKFSLILLLGLLLASPQLAAGSEKAAFILKDSRFPASSQHRIYWLDDDCVIFTGYEINLDKINKRGQYAQDQNIYIWDTREDRRSVYVKNASLGCYFRGYIRYSILEGPSKKGPMGQERTYLDLHYSKETWEREPPEWEDGVRMHPITCRSYQSRGVTGFVDLLPEHGYLDYRRPADHPPGDKVPIVWYRPGAIEGTKLPLMIHQYLDPTTVRYEQFMNGYVIGTTSFVEPAESYKSTTSLNGQAYSVWLFSADGNITDINVPYQDWMRGGTRNFYPALKGVFTWTHDWG